jgi:hypothetical protein
MFRVEMQFIPNMDVAWVERLSPDDEIYSFDTYEEAEEKATELQNKDTTGRKYRVKTIG